MATHSSVLAWRIPGMGEPGGLPSVGSHSQTRLKQLSSSNFIVCWPGCTTVSLHTFILKDHWARDFFTVALPFNFNLGSCCFMLLSEYIWSCCEDFSFPQIICHLQVHAPGYSSHTDSTHLFTSGWHDLPFKTPVGLDQNSGDQIWPQFYQMHEHNHCGALVLRCPQHQTFPDPWIEELLPWPLLLCIYTYSLAQTVKNLPAMQETWVRSLDWEDPLEEGMATHSSILAWRIPMDRGAWPATDNRVTKSQTQLWLNIWETKHNTFVYLSPLLKCELLLGPKGVLCSRSLTNVLKEWMDKQYRMHDYLT